MATLTRIVPCLWFADQAEDAARFYTSIFPNSRITAVSRYGEAGAEVHRRPPGSAMVVEFELDGVRLTALNGGPVFTFTPAISLQVLCESQEEIDHYWERLGEGGDPAAQRCGWLADRFGLSWQVVPAEMRALFADATGAGAARAMTAMLGMQKLDLAALRQAHAGTA